jgi:hypothetical protein
MIGNFKRFVPRQLTTVALVAICLGGAAIFANAVDRYYPIRDWLFWHLASIWGYELLFTAACLSIGHLVLVRMLGIRGLPRLEQAVVSMALGVIAFTMAMYMAGALALLRPWFAIALPVLMVTANGTAILDIIRDINRAAKVASRVSLLAAVLTCAGVLCVAWIYLALMAPSSLNCDARWFHITAAQDFAREGRIVPAMADWARNAPHLTSIVHTWAFLVPGLSVPVRWMMVLHTEFTLFVFTLAGVTAAVRAILRTRGAAFAWTAFFLFPSIFVYDSNLGGAADHVLAFFAIPLLVTTLRNLESPSVRMGCCTGLIAGGALLTKPQGIYMVVPVAVLLGVRALTDAAMGRLRKGAPATARMWPSALAFSSGALLVMLPYFIENAVFHHNPVFPFFMELFPSFPALPDGQRLYDEHLAHIEKGPLIPRVRDALKLLFTFSFEHHSPYAIKPMPFIGSLFSLLIPVAVFFREKRLWYALFIAVVAFLCWACNFPSARNLQGFLPIMVAFAAALIARLWSQGFAVRTAVFSLIALQVVWGADEPFLSSHGAIAGSMSLIRSGAEGRAAGRFDGYRANFRSLGKAIPSDGLLLLHTTYDQLGIDRRIVLDWPGFQGLIDYRPMRTARDVFDRFRAIGITHIAVDRSWPAHSKQEEAVFDAFLYRYGVKKTEIAPYQLWTLPAEPPPTEPPYRVLCLGLNDYPDGLYDVDELDKLDDGRQDPRSPIVSLDDPANAAFLMRLADVIFVSRSLTLRDPAIAALRARFTNRISYTRYTVYIR